MTNPALSQKGADATALNRWARYGPLLFWLGFIWLASTGAFAAGNTSRFIRPLLAWLFPNASAAELDSLHLIVRKLAHFLEYAFLAFLARRAFFASTNALIQRHWFKLALLLVLVNSLLDELHQSFVAERTGSIYDSAIDFAGGLTVLVIFKLFVKRSTDARS